MFRQHKFYLASITIASAMVISGGNAMAQCSRGGGGGMPTGSPSTLATGLTGMQYPQHQLARIDQQINALAYQAALRAQMRNLDYQQRVLPMRMARAEANRIERQEKIAARIAERDANQQTSPSEYSLASINVD